MSGEAFSQIEEFRLKWRLFQLSEEKGRFEVAEMGKTGVIFK
jgi:hypothetical protein